jgi:DNA polymerase III delta subunit
VAHWPRIERTSIPGGRPLRRVIRKLRLRQGDIIVVNTGETAQRLMTAVRHVKMNKDVLNIPIVIAPEGLHRLSVKQLKKILERKEKLEAQVKTFLGGDSE